MPKPSKVHPKHKTTYRVENWPEYEQALRSRGDLTVWISEDVRAAWVAPPSGKRGAQPIYDDVAIEACLTIGMLFRLPLRQAEGFVRSLFVLANIDLPVPDHTLVSRRRESLQVELSQRPTDGPLCLVFDATGLKVFGQGDWATKKHGIRGSGWRKLHIGVQRDGLIVAAKLTDSDVRDHEPIPDLLEQINGPIDRITADGAYDQESIYSAARDRGASPVIPPRKTAAKSGGDPVLAERDAAIDRISEVGRTQWKKEAGYHQQGRAENSFFRYKALLGSRLRARTPEGQETEVLLGVRILNRHHDLGAPDSVAVVR
jgi:hypothetical protein